jgi:hypothetical protein
LCLVLCTVAQLVEQWPVKPEDEGSRPSCTAELW